VNGLFRTEALQAQRGQWLGAINLAAPLSYGWWALPASIMAAAIAALPIFGQYTRCETVMGQLLPGAGMLALGAGPSVPSPAPWCMRMSAYEQSNPWSGFVPAGKPAS
jgi:hypothetical protein